MDVDIEDHIMSGTGSIDQQTTGIWDDNCIEPGTSNDGVATPRIINAPKMTRLAERGQRWESLKDDVHRLYFGERKTLPATMAAIQEMYQFTASPRTWKTKLKEWGFDKYVSKEDMAFVVAKADQRIAEGKDTVFYHRNSEIAMSKIQNFRRKQQNSDTSIKSPHSMDTPSFITYETPKPEDTEITDLDYDVQPELENCHPVESSDSVVPTALSPPMLSNESSQTITQQNSQTALMPTLIDALQRSRFDDVLKSYVQHNIRDYPLLSVLKDFTVDRIITQTNDFVESSDFSFEVILQRWIPHERYEICSTGMSRAAEALCIGGILAVTKLGANPYSYAHHLIQFLEHDSLDYEDIDAAITTYTNLEKHISTICGHDCQLRCRLLVVLGRLSCSYNLNHFNPRRPAERQLEAAIDGARELGDLCLSLRIQLILANYYRLTGFPLLVTRTLSCSLADYVANVYIVPYSICRSQSRTPKGPDEEINVEARLARHDALTSDECWELIEQSTSKIHRLIGMVHTYQNVFSSWSAMATIAGTLSSLGFLEDATLLFDALFRRINAPYVYRLFQEDTARQWNMKIYVYILRYMHSLRNCTLGKSQKADTSTDAELCLSSIVKLDSFLTEELIDTEIARQFHELEKMFVDVSLLDTFSTDNLDEVTKYRTNEEPNPDTLLFLSFDDKRVWSNNGLIGRHILLEEELSDIIDAVQIEESTPNPIPSLSVLPIAVWNESGQIVDHNGLGPFGPMTNGTTRSRYQASRSKGSIISGSRISTNSTSSGMKSIKYGVTYSEGSVMSLDLTELFN